MSEFSAIDLTNSAPEGICPACAVSGLKHISGAVVVYCVHFESAAWRVGDGTWHVDRGIAREHFRAAILLGILEGEHLAAELSNGRAGAIQ